jgi:hypothetical protein
MSGEVFEGLPGSQGETEGVVEIVCPVTFFL